MNSVEQISLPIKKEDRVLIAVSGGVDSMALLHKAKNESENTGFKIAVAHLNHGIRQESDADESLVREFCRENNITFYSKKVDLNSLEYSGLSTEEAGRKARYSYFAQLIKENDFNILLTAHHLDDQAETLILRMVRGTGPKGLCGIREISDFAGIKLIRPFLSISKVEILKYCNKNHIPYTVDKTNTNIEYTRNLIRNKVIPQLERAVPATKERIANLAKLQLKEQTFLNQIVEKIAERCLTETEDGIQIKSKLFTSPTDFLEVLGLEFLDEESIIYLQSEIIRKALEKINGLYNTSADHIEIIRNHFTNSTSGYIDLPNGKKAYKSSGICEIINFKTKLKSFNTNCSIEYNGKPRIYYFPQNRLKLTVKTGSKEDFSKTSKNSVVLKKPDKRVNLVFRKRQQGDRIKLKGMTSSKKLSRFYIDKKIPERLRDSIPVLADGNEIIWIPGYYINRDYMTDFNTEEVIFLELKSY